jgi:hypothetical protein
MDLYIETLIKETLHVGGDRLSITTKPKTFIIGS